MTDITTPTQINRLFSLNKTEIEALAIKVNENAVTEAQKLELLWQLKALQEFLDHLMGKDKTEGIFKPSAIEALRKMLGTSSGTITVGSADIQLQSVSYKDYTGCNEQYDKNIAEIARLNKENKEIEEMSANAKTEILHSVYGMIYPCKFKDPTTKLVVKLHRL